MKKYAFLLSGFLLLPLLLPGIASPSPGDTLQVRTKMANLREGPGRDRRVLAWLRGGTAVVEKARQGDWLAVRVISTGREGWLHVSVARAARKKSAGETPASAGTSGPVRPVPSPGKDAATTESCPKIGAIDLQQIISASRKGREARKYVDGLEPPLSEEERSRKEKELVVELLKEIMPVVEAYAREEGFAHIIEISKGSFVFSDERYDVTAAVLERYDRQAEPAE